MYLFCHFFFEGRPTDTHFVNILMKMILSSSSDTTENNRNKHLLMQKDVDVRLYYRIALNYTPSNLH